MCLFLRFPWIGRIFLSLVVLSFTWTSLVAIKFREIDLEPHEKNGRCPTLRSPAITQQVTSNSRRSLNGKCTKLPKLQAVRSRDFWTGPNHVVGLLQRSDCLTGIFMAVWIIASYFIKMKNSSQCCLLPSYIKMIFMTLQ